MRQMSILMVEDEKQTRDRFEEYVSSLKHTIKLSTASGESKGLELVQKLVFDAIILDLEFHESDGDGLEFLKKIKRLNLASMPYIVITTNNSSAIVRENARKNGADYVFWKQKRDYSPKLVVDHLKIYFDFLTQTCNDEVVQVKELSLEEELTSRFHKAGFTDELFGTRYVIDAVLIVARSNDTDINLHNDVLPIISRKYKKSVESVNRAIITAINKAWSIVDDEELREFYPVAVSGSKGAPTNKEFIFYFANHYKDSCKA